MKKFEYKQVSYRHYPSPEELDKEGADGWELVHMFPIKKEYFDSELEYYYTREIYKATFKREIYGSN